ncbi:MAG: N-acetyltransferase [Cyanosarcina radialis HA8281-LM2]|jgi:putative acetyltransferase|nr:N-acetyltransferase [Cyanosarcina radialis HA8281-LM2]
MEIRAEKPEDAIAIRQVNVAAFGRENEANLVDRLRAVESTFSLVAVEFDRIVGHIFFSPVALEGQYQDPLFLLGLAPLAVLPNYQRQGIGSLLVRHGLKECVRLGVQAVFVLGNPKYYRRFGFVTAKEKGLGCEYKVPDEAFMVLELQDGSLVGCRGTVKYRSEFRECE